VLVQHGHRLAHGVVAHEAGHHRLAAARRSPSDRLGHGDRVDQRLRHKDRHHGVERVVGQQCGDRLLVLGRLRAAEHVDRVAELRLRMRERRQALASGLRRGRHGQPNPLDLVGGQAGRPAGVGHHRHATPARRWPVGDRQGIVE
jgi:hypothetical protein